MVTHPPAADTPPNRAKPLLVITGPTASGKTAAALTLAERVPIEVISADSRQVYRHLDIGTAKPTPEQRRRTPHHVIDVVCPDQSFSAHDFMTAAHRAIRETRARGRTPVVVGGTGLYLTALIQGSPLGGVPPHPALRAELERLLAAEGANALVERLRQVDAARLAGLDSKNPRRLIRAIEIAEGQPESQSAGSYPPLHATVLGVALPREELAERIVARVEHMYAQGLIEEIQRLLAMGYAPDLPALSGVGYREAGAYLDGELTLEAARQRTIVRTRQFARRQRTWFRHQLPVNWHRPEEIVEAAHTWVRRHAACAGA